MKKLGLFLLVVSAITYAASPAKERVWQEGMLLNPENNGFFRSIEKTSAPAMSTGFHGTTTGNGDAAPVVSSVKDNFVLNAGDSAYLVERARLSSSQKPNLFITMQVKFYVEKDKLHMVDRDGKEVVTKIVKQSRKESPATGQ